MKDRRQIERYVRKALVAWRIELDLVTWDFDLRFRELGKHGGDIVAAKIDGDWVYKNVSLVVNSPSMARLNYTKAQIAKTLGHELVHLKDNRGWSATRDLMKLVKSLLVKLEERETTEWENSPLMLEAARRISKL